MITEEDLQKIKALRKTLHSMPEKSGAFFGIGDGEEHAQLHTEHFEFPDSILPAAVSLFEKLLFL